MHIKDLLDAKGILLNTTATSKEDAIHKLADLMDKSGKLVDKEVYLQDIMTREASGSTGLGDGIAIPHAKSKGVKTAGLAVMTIPGGIDFDSMDELPARLFFMIAAPTAANDAHLAILSHLATMIMDTDFKEALIAAKTPAEFIQLIDDKESGQYIPKQPKEETQVAIDDSKKILAVTACPTGIAHTFMAAESLEQVAKAQGIWLKVEKNASAGTIDGLTSQEIAEAHCIIIAADKNVEMARFDGKPLIKTKVANGINKANELLDQALNGHVPVYHHQGTVDKNKQQEEVEETVSRQIYKHLMNGVSHMLPFVIGGGILIALAFLFDTFDPANPGNFGSNTPLAAFLKNIGGISFGFMLPVLAGYIAMSIADRPGLAVGFVGGALANAGGSGFLGALLAGFAAGYIVLLLKKLFKGLPSSLEGIKPILLYPVLGILLMGIIIVYIINPPVAGLNSWLIDTLQNMDTSSRILVGLIFGGMMAVDMGGPINKAAYVIATGSLASGEFGIMASVMAGGMVPPIAIALCTMIFRNKFTEHERKSGPTNIVMGLSFITEGAIPFAASDPLRVIPACVIGSGIAGALSMAFGCTLRAPHGGIFVVPTIGNPLFYLLAILLGSIVGCLILGAIKQAPTSNK